jgi:hypothetical protein
MNKLKYIILIFLFSSGKLLSQVPLEVADQTFKLSGLGGEEEFYYGFETGDQLIFNFQELEGKELKELEIIELPSSSKFMGYKTKRIDNKVLNIQRTGIYKFRFSNSALSSRICKVRILRIPASEETKNFNTSVYFKTVYDTSYTTVPQRYLIKADTIIENITDQVAKVHSQGNLNNNKTTFNFTLPANTVAWSYYIGVDQAGQQAYQYATKELAYKAAPIVARIPGYGPLTALALGGTSYLSTLQSGEDIDFYIVEGNNVNYFLAGQQFYFIKRGKVINDYSRMLAPLSGTFNICLANDNAITEVTVAVKITAIVVNEQWGIRSVTKMQISSKQVPYLRK